MSEVMEINGSPPAPRTDLSPMMQLVEKAVLGDVPMDKLEHLMALQERYDAQQARSAYFMSMARAKRRLPEILKNKTVSFRNKDGSITEYTHETLDHLINAVRPVLSEEGIDFSYRIRRADGRVWVSCVVFHEMGHTEEVELDGPPDDSGKKNAIQQTGSTITYLQRYTLKAALGLAAGIDTDGHPVPDEDGVNVIEWKAKIDRAAQNLDKETLVDVVGPSISADVEAGKLSGDDLARVRSHYAQALKSLKNGSAS